MLKPEQIPDEVWKLVQLCTGVSEAAARGLAAGVINTWPGTAWQQGGNGTERPLLPMPQEKTND